MITISVITVVLNAAQTIEKTINNVIAQQFQNTEYIIVDGGSTDGTVEIIEKYRQSGRVSCFICENDNGIYDAMNKGVRVATGDLIGFLNAGDYYEPGILHRIAKEYDGMSDVIYGKTLLRMPDGSQRCAECSELDDIVKGMVFGHQASFVLRNSFARFGLFDEKYKIAGDYDWFLRCYFGGGRFQKLEADIVKFGWGGVSSILSGQSTAEKINCRMPYLDNSGIRGGIMDYLEKLPAEIFAEKMVTEPKRASEAIKALLDKGKKIAIYGYGVMGHLVENLCHEYGIGIDFIADASIKESREIYSDKGHLLGPAEKVADYSGKVLISIKSVRNADEIGLPKSVERKYMTLTDVGKRMLLNDSWYNNYVYDVTQRIKNRSIQ